MDVILLCFAVALLAADMIFLYLCTSAVEGDVKTLRRDSEDLAVTIAATLETMSNMLLDMTNAKKFKLTCKEHPHINASGYYEKLPAKPVKKPTKKRKN